MFGDTLGKTDHLAGTGPRHGGRGEGQVLVILGAATVRCAAIASFVHLWAQRSGLDAATLELQAPLPAGDAAGKTRLVVASLDAGALADEAALQCLRECRARMPDAPLIVMSESENPSDVLAAFQAGARGYIPTAIEPALALQAVDFIFRGGSFVPPSVLPMEPAGASGVSAVELPSPPPPPSSDAAQIARSEAPLPPCGHRKDFNRLTARQRDVLRHLCRGASNKVIARALGMTEATVKVHVRQIMNKFGASNRTQVALHAMDSELADPPAAARIEAGGADFRGMAGMEDGAIGSRHAH